MSGSEIRRKRRCVGCGTERPKGAFIRVTRSSGGVITPFAAEKEPGRGAYICADAACVASAKKRDALARSLKCKIDSSVYDQLADYCAKLDNNRQVPSDADND